jgi:hypothetical protein
MPKKRIWKKKEAGDTALLNIVISIILGVVFFLYLVYTGRGLS